MRKKLFKYIKFLISMVLILGLVAPSYASLSASDGSAFVTKAEFDSALADFNSRLTTFEAGINSKIDSQVTSYLDRNGIWNGKLQNIEKNYWARIPFLYGPNTTYKARGIEYKGDANAFWAKSQINANTVGKQVVVYSDWFIAVQNISKSGLCCLNGRIENIATLNGNKPENSKVQYWALPSDKDKEWQVSQEFTINFHSTNINRTLNPDHVDFQHSSNDGHVSTSHTELNSNRGAVVLQVEESVFVLYFFVNKNDILYVNDYGMICPYTETSTSGTANAWEYFKKDEVEGSKIGYRLQIDRVVIY